MPIRVQVVKAVEASPLATFIRPASQPDPAPSGFCDPAGRASSRKEWAASRMRVGVEILWPTPVIRPASYRSTPAFRLHRAELTFRPTSQADLSQNHAPAKAPDRCADVRRS